MKSLSTPKIAFYLFTKMKALLLFRINEVSGKSAQKYAGSVPRRAVPGRRQAERLPRFVLIFLDERRILPYIKYIISFNTMLDKG